MSNDVLELVCLRNDFYRRQYHWILAVCLLGAFAIAALIGMLVYVIDNPTRPLYFVTDKAGRFIRDIPVQDPNMTTDEVAAWTIKAVEAAYTYDFVNYHAQLQDAQNYFTDYGWRNYMKGLDASNNLVALRERRMIATARVVGQPVLLGEGRLGSAGVYSYKFEMPLLVTYLTPPYNEKSKFNNAYQISVIVQRQSILSSYNGLGVVQLIGASATG